MPRGDRQIVIRKPNEVGKDHWMSDVRGFFDLKDDLGLIVICVQTVTEFLEQAAVHQSLACSIQRGDIDRLPDFQAARREQLLSRESIGAFELNLGEFVSGLLSQCESRRLHQGAGYQNYSGCQGQYAVNDQHGTLFYFAGAQKMTVPSRSFGLKDRETIKV